MSAPVAETLSVEVRVFGRYRDSVPGDHVGLELPLGGTVRDLIDLLHREAPGRFPPRPSVAVNRKLARPDQVIRAGDEVALIPAVAGG